MKSIIQSEKGASFVIGAVLMSAAVLMAAFAIDTSYIMTARNQLQSAVDASALAAASGLTISKNEARNRGVSISAHNTIINEPLNLENPEISFPNYKSVRITAERDVPLYFAKLISLDSVSISASATAQCGNRDIMLIFDRSGSMDDDTVDPEIPQPITDTKLAANYFVDLVSANTFVVDRIGLVSYSSNARLERVLDRQFDAMKVKIASYEADGYTNIGDAIKKARNHLNTTSPSRTKKTMVLLSDGQANRPGSGMPTNPRAINYALQQAQYAANENIRIYTISLGNQADLNLMAQIASKTGGIHHFAPSTGDLYDIFKEISERVPSNLIS